MLAIFQYFGLFSLFFPSSVDLALDVGLGKLGISGKVVISTFPWHKSYVILTSGCKAAGFGIGAARDVSLLTVRFSVLILGN